MINEIVDASSIDLIRRIDVVFSHSGFKDRRRGSRQAWEEIDLVTVHLVASEPIIGSSDF